MRWRSIFVATLVIALGSISFGVWQGLPAEVGPSVETTVAPSQLVMPTPIVASPTATKVEVPPAAPVSMTIPEMEFSIPISTASQAEMAVAYNRDNPDEHVTAAIYAPLFDQAAWPNDYGSEPASTTINTVYFTCHSSALRPLPCNALALDGAFQPGYHLVVTTTSGVITYVLKSASLEAKVTLGSSEAVRLIRPNGAVLTVCMLKNGKRTEYSWVFVLEMEK